VSLADDLETYRHRRRRRGGSSDKRIGPALLKFSDKGNDRADPGNTWDKTGVLATNYRMSELLAAFGLVQGRRPAAPNVGSESPEGAASLRPCYERAIRRCH
jgi:hypothetical protein